MANGRPQFPAVIMDFNTTHPVMNSVGLSRVRIAQASQLTPPKGSLSLVDSTFGSIMAIAPREGFEDLVLGFPLVEYADDGELLFNTDWGSKLSFPLFVQNLLEVLAGGTRFQALKTSTPGDLVSIRTQIPIPEVRVIHPNKSTTNVKMGNDSSYLFSNTENAGIYQVEDPEDDLKLKMFAVNLMDKKESELTVRDKLEIGFEEISAVEGRVPVRKEYWTWLTLIALAFLMVEWLIYNRRVFI